MPSRQGERARPGATSGIEDKRFGREPIGDAGECAPSALTRTTAVTRIKMSRHDFAQARMRPGLTAAYRS